MTSWWSRLVLALRPKRSLENPASGLEDPEDWLFDSLGAGRGESGVRMSADLALKIAGVWRAVSLIAGDVAKTPLRVFRVAADDSREPDRSHPAHRVLYREAVPGEMSAFHFRFAIQAYALLSGNGYAFIERDGAGRVRSLRPLHPSLVTPERLRTGELVYHVQPEDGGPRVDLAPSQVFHLRALGDGIVGRSVIASARDSLAAPRQMDVFTSSYFRNQARPSVALRHPGRLDDDARNNLKRSLAAAAGGPSRAGGTLVLEEAMELETYGANIGDLEMVGLREVSLRDIANWFGVPPSKLGITGSVSYNSLEHENQAYLSECLDTYLSAWEAEAWMKLLTDRQRAAESHRVEFNRNALVRVAFAERQQGYAVAVQNGWLTRNEVRARENLPQLPELDEIDEPEETEPEAPEIPEEPEEEPGAREDLARDLARRWTRRSFPELHKRPDELPGRLERAGRATCRVLGVDSADMAERFVAQLHERGADVTSPDMEQDMETWMLEAVT